MKNRKAVALLLTLMFMTTLSVMIAAYLFLGNQGTKYASIQIDDTQSFYLSEAGLNKAVWYLMHTAPDGSSDGSWRTDAYPANSGNGPKKPKQESLAGGTYTMWVENSGGNVLVTARGTLGNVERVIQQEVLVSVDQGVGQGNQGQGKGKGKDKGGEVSVTVDFVVDTWREI